MLKRAEDVSFGYIQRTGCPYETTSLVPIHKRVWIARQHEGIN